MQNLIVNLNCLCELINLNTNITVKVENIYIDFGANWMDDTIVSTSPREYQLLSPRDIWAIKSSDFTIEDAYNIICEINKRDW